MDTSHRMSLNAIRRTTTPEYLGTEATQADVESYLELLEANWPTDDADEVVDNDTAEVVQSQTFRAWCAS
jgi:hypothetical protein